MFVTFSKLNPSDGRVTEAVALDPATVKRIDPGPHGVVDPKGFVCTSAILTLVIGNEVDRLIVDGTAAQAVARLNEAQAK